MSAASRRKGAAGEVEFARFLTQHGHDATRNARNGLTAEDCAHAIPGLWIEVKRTERAKPLEWARQAAKDAPDGVVPVVAFRASREPWRVILTAEDFLYLIDRKGYS